MLTTSPTVAATLPQPNESILPLFTQPHGRVIAGSANTATCIGMLVNDLRQPYPGSDFDVVGTTN